MKLVVFDIDGTLTLGDGLGTRCFFRAFEAAFGPCKVDARLGAYRESTDAGIATEAMAGLWGRLPEPAQLERFKSAYLSMLAQEIESRPGAYRPVRGSQRVLVRLAREHGWSVAIATGNWRRAAELKLASAGVETGEACGGYSEDGHTRTDVLLAAIQRAARRSRRPLQQVVYVGDQPWDLAAADAVGVPFLGIGEEARADGLKAAGARVVEDYERFETFLEALEERASQKDCSAIVPWEDPARPRS